MNGVEEGEALERAAHQAAELFVEIYGGLESRRVDPGATRSQVAELFSGTIQEDGIGLAETLNEFQEHVLPNSMGTPHPRYWGLVNSSPLPAGPLADLLVSSLNNNGGAFHQSPAITTLEKEVIAAFLELCGLSADASGMILPGGTFANLQGLMLARQRHFPQWQTEGPTSLDGAPTVYGSDVTHFCNARAANVIGIGSHGIKTIRSVERGFIDVAELEKEIVRDRADGKLPFAVVANAGTTGTGAIDPLAEIADVCGRQGVWFHVDACYGGGALLADPRPTALNGIERADSIAIDPHKWFFVPMTAGLLLTRHGDLEVETFDTNTSYIPGDGVVDAFRRGIPTSRRSSGLTIWMVLRAHGWRTIRESVQHNIRLTRLLENRLRDCGFRILEDGELSVACARWEPDGSSPDEVNRLQSEIVARVISSGKAWFNTVSHDGKTWLRLNLVNYHTREHHIDELVELIKTAAMG